MQCFYIGIITRKASFRLSLTAPPCGEDGRISVHAPSLVVIRLSRCIAIS